MARVRKTKEERAAARRARMAIPRSERRKPKPVGDPEDRTWLVRSKHRMMAIEILNRTNTFPWWASIEKDGPPPVAGYYPSCHFEYDGRVYMGFAFRHHRDEYVELSGGDARKEYTEPTVAKFRSTRK